MMTGKKRWFIIQLFIRSFLLFKRDYNPLKSTLPNKMVGDCMEDRR